MIQQKQFTFNSFQVNCYVLYDETKECVIIDAACYSELEKKELCDFIDENNLKPVRLLNTHCHVDHILGNHCITKKYGIYSEAHIGEKNSLEVAKEYGLCFGFDVEVPIDIESYIEDNQIITFGNSSLEAIHVPGHSLGSICFYSEVDKILISGDVLFHNSIGRTDLPGGNYEQLITGIKSKLFTLKNEVVVLPGHGNETSIGHEKWSNPFF